MDDTANRLAEVADDLRWMVRERHPGEVHAWLSERVAGLNEWTGLVMILAAATDDTAPFADLVAWVDPEPDPDFVDEVAVERACRGEPVSLTRAEKMAAIDKLTRRGMGYKTIAKTLGVTPRAVTRRRAEVRGAA